MERIEIKNIDAMLVNTFPRQGVETIRTEERQFICRSSSDKYT